MHTALTYVTELFHIISQARVRWYDSISAVGWDHMENGHDYLVQKYLGYLSTYAEILRSCTETSIMNMFVLHHRKDTSLFG